jgi:folate-binding protein YgfZ
MSHFGRFRVSGKDAAVLLHHLTTNNIKKLQPDQGCDAILISNKARVLDWLQIWRESGDSYLVLTSPNRRELFAPHARKFVLYQQDVTIEDVTERTALMGIFGTGVDTAVKDADGEASLDVPLNGVVYSLWDEHPLWLSGTRRLPGNGMLIGGNDAGALEKMAISSGAVLCDDVTYNSLRIEAGIPVTGLELTDEINPWEANFNFAISLDKGCYNGQEIIARLNTYKKIKQRLMGVRLESALPMGERFVLRSNGRNAGLLTSSATSSHLGAIGLAFIRTDYQEIGTVLEVESLPSQKAVICELPFGEA